MRQMGTSTSNGGLTDLNLGGSISEYAKDIILVIVLAQSASLIHRYLWFTLLIVRILVYLLAPSCSAVPVF